MVEWTQLARQVIERCESLAECTEEPGYITRTFLSSPMHEVHLRLRRWMELAGMAVTVDEAGNIRGRRNGKQETGPLYIGSHLDTVPHAGMFDGMLGVLIGVALIEASSESEYPIEVIGFSEEEGVRFGVPFLGSRAFIGDFPQELLAIKDRDGVSVAQSIAAFGLDPRCVHISGAEPAALGYLEFHIEQGPVLDSKNQSVAVVDSIVGQSRLTLTFQGKANHAGTTPMGLRHDALAGAAEWIQAVERLACETADLVATVGRLDVSPGAGNVIPSLAHVSLDLRHASDTVRKTGVENTLTAARSIAARRGLTVAIDPQLDQSAVAMDPRLVKLLEQSVAACDLPVQHLSSGAGHDAMVVARIMPSAMLFVRSPGGVSHHPDESVRVEDVADVLRVGGHFLELLHLERQALQRFGGSQ